MLESKQFDLKTITIKKFIVGDRIIKLKEPLYLEPYITESNLYIGVIDETYDIDLLAENRKQLIKEIKSWLSYSYEAYALHLNDNTLTQNAKEFKYFLLKNTYEIEGD